MSTKKVVSTKRIAVYLNEEEIRETIRGLKEAYHSDWDHIIERLEAELDTFEPDMYKEDKDGYETLTDEAKEGLRENEAWLKSGE